MGSFCIGIVVCLGRTETSSMSVSVRGALLGVTGVTGVTGVLHGISIAYGFIAGGLVVGVAVLFSGTLATPD